MIVGGEYYDENHHELANFDVEVIDLRSENMTCAKVADIPLSKGSAGTFMNGRPLVCGSYEPFESDCYTLNNYQGNVKLGSEIAWGWALQNCNILIAAASNSQDRITILTLPNFKLKHKQ